MIDKGIFDDFKTELKNTLKVYAWIVIAIGYFIFIVPTPEFEAGVSGDYTGAQLIETLPEKYAYLTDIIDKEHAYTEEGVGFVFLSLAMVAIVFFGGLWVNQMVNQLRAHDEPPPSLPDAHAMHKKLIRYGTWIWLASVTALSIIWCNLSPEYLLAGTGFWEALMTTLPFWILIGSLLAIAIAECVLEDVLKKRKSTKGGE